MTQRLLLLVTPKTYRAQAFEAAARKLGVEVVKAVDVPAELAEQWCDAIAVRFGDVDAATRAIVEYAKNRPLDAILSVDDSASLVAAQASAALGLPHNSPQAAEAARNKFVMRTLLRQHGVPVPDFRLYSTDDDLTAIAAQTTFPCVVKPLDLNGSRGVMRADNANELSAAIKRLSKLLHTLDRAPGPKPFLIEDFIPGFEVALEGLLDHGELHVLALFDKPDPLDGPFFEETIYVTPSRLPSDVATGHRQMRRRFGAGVGSARWADARRTACERSRPVAGRGRRAIDRRIVLANAAVRTERRCHAGRVDRATGVGVGP